MTAPAQAQTPEQLALEHAAQQAQIRAAAAALVLAVWASAPSNLEDWLFWWFGEGRDQIYGAIGMGQELMASEARPYVIDSLSTQGYEVDAPQINPLLFAGTASDGTSLEDLLDQVAWRMIFEARDKRFREAQIRAEGLLNRIVFQQITDAGREADQVVIAGSAVTDFAVPTVEPILRPIEGPAEPPPPRLTREERDRRLADRKRANGSPIGWIRMLTPPSCGRCAVLAGKWYGWNDGFQRHDNCDCRHIPALESDAGDLTTDPLEYFNSLPTELQDDYFGKANAEAIRNGANISQVMNASTTGTTYTVDGRTYTRSGTTRRGFYGRTEPGRKRVLRPTPATIYREAAGDRQEAVRLLRRFGYIVT